MKDFEYEVSVVVPVYNVEKYVAKCLDSLIKQTIDKAQMEVIVINDGSTDNSLEICKDYALVYPFIKVHTKENEGLSATRNYGIQRAKGKYIMFLDSDDTLTQETVKEVTDYFDSVYDQVDLVTYLDQGYKFGNKLPLHFRYNYLKKSGVYDLNEFPFLTQTRVNICVKNMDDNILFDTTPGFRQEDQEYNCRVLREKMKIGYCDKGEYQYNRSNETSIMATSYNAIEMFETCMKYFEDLFASFPDEVPRYYQAMYIHDLQWKVRENILFPYHYEKDDFRKAEERIADLLDRVDEEVIMTHPNIDNFHRFFWLKMKKNNHAAVYGTDQYLGLVVNGRTVYKRNKIELILYRIHILDGKVKILLCAKSPVFSFVQKPDILAVINGREEVPMELMPSSFNYYRSKTETNRFWTFYFEYDLCALTELKFVVEVDGIGYDTNYYFMNTSPYNLDLKMFKYIHEDYLVHFRSNVFYFSHIDENKKKEVWNGQTQSYEERYPEHYIFRSNALKFQKSRPIWLYYDCKGVAYDNGYYQFIHDFEKEDGVDRYYISNNPYEQRKEIFDEAHMNHVISFGGDLHKILYIHADKIITGYIEERNISPFAPKDAVFYKDLFHFEIVYLQHGILHASLPWKYTPERINVDKVVVSSFFEIENFVQKYNFREKDLIKTGMPRFDFMEKKIKPVNRILFAPTWRNYLITLGEDDSWLPDTDKFKKSDFYIKFQEFLNSERLAKILEDYDLYLDFKIHPIFKPYENCFSLSRDRVSFASDIVDDNQYSVFITDFSSFVFDFAYLERPIIYFVPDMLQFKAGLNQYRALDLPFEKAFGDLAVDPETAVDAIERIAMNGLQPEKIYKERMEKFYLPLENCRENIYQNLMCEEIYEKDTNEGWNVTV